VSDMLIILLNAAASLVVHTSVMCTGAAGIPPRPIMSEAHVAERYENCVHEQIARALFEAAGDTESSRELLDEMFLGDAELYQRLPTDPSIGFAEAYKKKLDNIRSRFAERDSGGAVTAIHVSASDVATLLLLGSLADLPGDSETHRRASLEVFRSEIGDVLVERSMTIGCLRMKTEGLLTRWRFEILRWSRSSSCLATIPSTTA
jgi:hypothetical protein